MLFRFQLYSFRADYDKNVTLQKSENKLRFNMIILDSGFETLFNWCCFYLVVNAKAF